MQGTIGCKGGISQKELTNYKAREEKHWTNKKEMFLKLPELFDLLGSRSAFLLEQGFKGVVIQQFQEASYPQDETPIDFLNLQKVVNNIPDYNILD